MKKNAIVMALVGTLMITSGGIMSFVTSFAKDVNDAKENSETILTQYTEFKNLMEVFNSKRESLYSDVMNELYVESANDSYDTWLEKLHDYESTVEQVQGYKGMLEQRCLGILYNDTNIQSQCDSMLLSYETAINYYVKDIHKFNSFVSLYNASVDELNQKSAYDLKEYNYTDFNDDGKYLGK